MKKCDCRHILALLCAVCLTGCLLWVLPGDAVADEIILHTPEPHQIQQAEAIRIACDLIREKTGVELTGLYREENGRRIDGQVEAYFGPGWQWLDNSDIEEDCWVLTLQNETRILRPVVVLHGTSGEALHWSFSDREANASYVDMVPTQGQLSLEEAKLLAQERYTGHAACDIADLILVAEFGRGDCFNDRWGALPPVPMWYVYVMHQAVEGTSMRVVAQYQMAVNADSGKVLLEVLTDFSSYPPQDRVITAVGG